MTLLEYLFKKDIIDREKRGALEYEIKTSGKTEEEVIIERGIIPEKPLFDFKSQNLKIPLRDVAPEDVVLKVLELIPYDSAKYYKMIPISKKDDQIDIGMVYPEDLKAQEALKFLSRQAKFSYKIFLITLTNFDNISKQYRSLKEEVEKALTELEVELKTGEAGEAPMKKTEFERKAEEAPVTKIVAVILRHAVEGSASDIHVEPTKKDLRVRFRLDGILHASLILPLKVHPAVVARIKILSNLKIDETRLPQDGRFSINIGEKNIDFRVSTLPTTLGEKVVLRILDPSQGLVSLESLGLRVRNLEILKRAIQRPYGMILSTGPTGSGKTTTLYSVLHLLNKIGVNIITLEDPVEYFIEGINQSQVKPEIGYTFATGLRHILRQDPNVIMVGEIRDGETASLAVNAALTGHIVLSTLHTNNALGVIPRLIDLGVAPFLMPSSLSVAIAQRLARRLCPHCKKEASPNPKVKEMIISELSVLPPSAKEDIKLSKSFKIYEPVGCAKCRSEGYSGRIAFFEVLEMTPQLAEIILKEPTESKIKEEAFRQGMITMKQDGMLKVLGGVTSLAEVLRVAEEK
ncbi:MAG: Flp pilus assembly complex ATPase component TadA [Candidatus Nealsonbacteria bacterium]|nr:Flp pilus assembly complex ATPase component TadA [Candidatus Nealsonbacteria bacterium]